MYGFTPRNHYPDIYRPEITCSSQVVTRDPHELSFLPEITGSALLPNLRQYDPGRPTRADQMRETTRNAISDMYNGESEIYSSLRAAAYVMAQMVYVPEQETSRRVVY